jgi:hypothetical protein
MLQRFRKYGMTATGVRKNPVGQILVRVGRNAVLQNAGSAGIITPIVSTLQIFLSIARLAEYQRREAHE